MKVTCLNCNHFPVCRVNNRARKEGLLYGGGAEKFFEREAGDCDFYEEVKDGNSADMREMRNASPS